MATKILFAPKQSDAVLEIARSLTPAGFELLIAEGFRVQGYSVSGFSSPGALPERSARTPMTNGISTFSSAFAGFSEVMWTRGGRTRRMNF